MANDAAGSRAPDPGYDGNTQRRQSILRLLVTAYPLGVDAEDMISAYYSGSKATSENVGSMVRQIVTELRIVLRRHGWTIPRSDGGRQGPGAYRLERLL